MEKIAKQVSWSDSDESDETDEESPRKFVKNDERRCKYCVKLFRNELNVEQHEKICKIGAKNTAKLVKAKDGNIRFLCDVCYRTFKFLTGLTKHKLRHEPPGGYECKFCDNTRYCTDAELQKHKEIMHMVYKCKICKEKMDNRDKYVEHILRVHDGRQLLYAICEDCGQQFRTRSVLSYHKQSMCGTIKPFTCERCNSKFQNQWSLKNHLQIHKGEKKFCCSYCGNSFMKKGQLVVHERKHTKEKPFVCNICSKAFSYRESLVTHSSVHTGIKPYLCEACGACFSCFSNLQKHRRHRPNTCGQPQFNKNTKIAPRASFKSGKLTRQIKVGKGNLVLEDTIKRPTENNANVKKLKCKSKKSKTDKTPLKTDENHDNKNDDPSPDKNIKDENIRITENLENENQLNAVAIQQSTINSELIVDDTEDKKTLKLENPINDGVVATTNSNDNIVHVFEVKISELSENDDDNEEYDHNNYEIQIYNESSNNNSDDNDNDDDDDDKRNIENLLNQIEIINTSSNHLDDENLKEEEEEKKEILIEFEENNENDNVSLTKCVKEKSVEEVKNVSIKFDKTDTLNSCDNDDCNEDNDDDDDDIPLSRIKYKISLIKQQQQQNIDKKNDNSNIDDQKIIKKCKIEITANYDNDEKFQPPPPPSESNNSNLNSKKSNHTIKDTNKLFECDKCPKFYHQRKSYVKHLVTEHDMNLIDVEKSLDEIEMIRCKYCAKIYKQNASLKKHEKLHGPKGKLIHKCPCCRKYFETIEDAKRHTKTKHSDQLTCTICQKMYTDLNALMVHRKRLHSTVPVTHSDNKNDYHDNNVNDNDGDNDDDRDVHDDNNSTENTNTIEKLINERMKKMQHICQKCGRKFAGKTALNNHERSDCGKNPLYKCDVCDKRYNSHGSLKTHHNIHTKKTLFNCTYCHKPFTTYGQLKVHERKHNGIKPFKCDQCDKAFAYRESLFTHMSTHTGIKRYTCYGCGTRFSCISNLQNHRTTHFNTCGLLPLNTKPIEFMGYDRGTLYMGNKPFG